MRSLGDDLRDTGTICHDIQIAEPQDTKSLRFQERITALIPNKAGGLVVLATVDLDDELRGVTDEIRDIGADRRLPAEQSSFNGGRGRCSSDPLPWSIPRRSRARVRSKVETRQLGLRASCKIRHVQTPPQPSPASGGGSAPPARGESTSPASGGRTAKLHYSGKLTLPSAANSKPGARTASQAWPSGSAK